MNLTTYCGYRFPPEIISHSVWMYHRFCLSLRDVEELLAKRGVLVTYETIRQWCRKFGPEYARNLKRRQGRLGDIWYLDEVFGSPHHCSLREQSSRGIASTDATTRASDATVQVSGSSAAVPVGPRGHSELLQILTPPDEFG